MHLRYVSRFPLIAAVVCVAASASLGACGGTGPVDDDVAAADKAQELTAESAEGKGTAFTLTLPCLPDAETRIEPEPVLRSA